MQAQSTTKNAAGASPLMTRRSWLKGASLASATLTLGLAADPVASDEPEMTAMERVDYLLAELKIAIQYANPKARVEWCVNHLDNPESSLPIVFVSAWVTGKYDGDGFYYYSHYKSICEVKLLEKTIDGERVFSVIAISDPDRPMELTEGRLTTFIRSKVEVASHG